MITFYLNDKKIEYTGDGDQTLLNWLRCSAGITSVKDGCSGQAACGACMVEINGKAKLSCTQKMKFLADSHVITMEGIPGNVRDVIAKADEAYFNKDISIARFYYNKALSMKKDDKYPGMKLKDIQKLIEQDSQDKKNQDYLKLIADGDQALKLENFSIARFNYNKALTMKPDEKYPKDQLKQIKEALDKPKK